MRRKFFTLCAALSLSLCVAAGVLRFRSRTTSDAGLIALPGGRAILISSNQGRPVGWLEITLLSNWPEPGVRWSSRPWQSTGPFKFWQRSRVETFGRGRWWMMWGDIAVVRESPGGPIAYRDGIYRVAALNGWAGVPPGSPDYAFPRGWEVRAPHSDVVVITAVLPLVWLGQRTRSLARRIAQHGREHRRGHCLSCGYDLRASPERCPECGREAGKEAA